MTDLDPLEEAMRQPLEDPLTRWKREAEEQEARFAEARAKRARSAEPAPVDWDLRIATVVADERQYILDLMAEIIAETAARQREAIDDAMRPLQGELAQLKASIAEQRVKICELQLSDGKLREQLAGDRSKVFDLPDVLQRRGLN
jgi:hypothetical protein